MLNPFARVIKEATYLYRRILRIHRHLPSSLRDLGDAHVKHEWREVFLNRKNREHIENPEVVRTFLSSWKNYAETLEKGELGEEMTEELGYLNNDQVEKLSELKDAANRDSKTS